MSEVFLFNSMLRINGLNGEPVESAYDETARFSGDASVKLVSVKNQAVSFQIGLAPSNGKLSSFSAQFSDLKSEKGLISGSAFSIFGEWFHHVREELVPDLLLPWDIAPEYKIPMDMKYLADQKAGAVWVDLWIDRDTPAGDYSGGFKVIADGKEYTFQISVEVLNEVLPDKAIITTDLNNYADSLSPHFDSLKHNPKRYYDGSYLKVEREFFRMARDHRCVFHNLPYRHSGKIPPTFIPELEGEGKYMRVKSWERFDEHLGPYLDGSAFEGCRNGEHPVEFMYLPFNLGWPANYEKWCQKGYRTEYRRILTEFVRHFDEKGWDKTNLEITLNHKKDYRYFPYTVDEIWYEHDQEAVDLYYDIVKDIYDTSSCKFMLRMDSSNHFGHHFDHRFSDYCKMWVAGFAMFNWFPESVKVLRDKGDILWIYGGVLKALDESLNSLLVWPMQTMMTGATGFCVWNTTGFGDDPLACPEELGGQTVFYPGSYFGYEGPLPSIRLKVLRNATQLADLTMSFKATPLESTLDKVVNAAYGRKDNADWFMPKPPFIDIPPRYWDFSANMNQYCLPQLYKGQSYGFADQLTGALYNQIKLRNKPVSPEIVFQYQ